MRKEVVGPAELQKKPKNEARFVLREFSRGILKLRKTRRISKVSAEDLKFRKSAKRFKQALRVAVQAFICQVSFADSLRCLRSRTRRSRCRVFRRNWRLRLWRRPSRWLAELAGNFKKAGSAQAAA